MDGIENITEETQRLKIEEGKTIDAKIGKGTEHIKELNPCYQSKTFKNCKWT